MAFLVRTRRVVMWLAPIAALLAILQWSGNSFLPGVGPTSLLSGQQTRPGIQQAVLDDLDDAIQNPEGSERFYAVARFRRIPTVAERVIISREFEVVFLDAIPENSYILSLPLADAKAIMERLLREATPRVTSVYALDEASRASDVVRSGNFPPYAVKTSGNPPIQTKSVYVRFFRDVLIITQREVLRSHGVVNIDSVTDYNAEWRVEVPDTFVESLRKHRLVQWVEEIEAPPVPDNDGARSAMNVPGNLPAPGSGVTIGQWELCHPASAPDHPDYAARIVPAFSPVLCTPQAVNVSVGNNLHATMVAGILIGNGAQSDLSGAVEQWRGVATAASILAYSVADSDSYSIYDEYRHAAANSVRIANNSWGPGSGDFYYLTSKPGYHPLSSFFDSAASAMDASGAPAGPGQRMLIVATSGNEGEESDWRTARIRNSAKNVLTVGNVASGQGDAKGFPAFDSGRGPTNDGRTKPDLVAPGAEIAYNGSTTDGGIHSTSYPPAAPAGSWYDTLWGTSFSAPAVAGTAAILSATFRDLACDREQTPAELRGVLVNTAMDLVDATKDATSGKAITALINNGNLTSFTAQPNTGYTPGQAAATDPALFNHATGLSNLVGPDYIFGYGMVQADQANDFVRDNHFVIGAIGNGFVDYPIFIKSAVLEAGDILRITLAWDDLPFSVNSAPSEKTGLLMNDLDLVVIDPQGRRYFPWKLDHDNPELPAVQPTRGKYEYATESLGDHRNTIEQVAIKITDQSLLDKTWTVQVRGSTVRVPRQEYALVSSVINPGAACGDIPKLQVNFPGEPNSFWIFWFIFWIGIIVLILLLIELSIWMYRTYEPQYGDVEARARVATAFLMILLLLYLIFNGLWISLAGTMLLLSLYFYLRWI